MDAKVFNNELLDDLRGRAMSAPRLRQHHNIHTSYADPVQRLLNAVEPGSYIPPHRHAAARDELMVAARGLLALLLFDDCGEVVQVQLFGAGFQDPDAAFAVEAPAGRWHSVVALESGSILLEVKAGPFDPDAPAEFAPWAPPEGTDAARDYQARLQAAALAMARNRPFTPQTRPGHIKP